MAANNELMWTEIDERTVEVAALLHGDRVAVRLEFDDAGDVARAYSDARPYASST